MRGALTAGMPPIRAVWRGWSCVRTRISSAARYLTPIRGFYGLDPALGRRVGLAAEDLSLEQHSLADAAAADSQRRAQQLRGRLKDEQAGRQQPHPLMIEGEPLGQVAGALGAEHAQDA